MRMAKYVLPCFGQLDSENLERYYDCEINFNNTMVSVHETSGIEKFILAGLKLQRNSLSNWLTMTLRTRSILEQDYKEDVGDTVRAYIEHHLDELGETELNELIQPIKQKNKPVKTR